MVDLINELYRYITKRDDKWQLRYKGEHYGWYNRIEEALFDRDRLESVDWDISVFVELPELPNPYDNMNLPEYEEHIASYIQHIPEKWRVQKRINGKLCYFGVYDTLEEAEKRRAELIRNRWSK